MILEDLEEHKVMSDKHLKKCHETNPRLSKALSPKMPYDPRIRRRLNCSDTSFRESYLPRIIHPHSQQIMRIEHWSTNIQSSASSRRLDMMNICQPWEALRSNFTRNRKSIGDCEVLPVCSEELDYEISSHGDEVHNKQFEKLEYNNGNQFDNQNSVSHKNLSMTKYDSQTDSCLSKKNQHPLQIFSQGHEERIRKSKSRPNHIKKSQSFVLAYKDLKHRHYRTRQVRSHEDCRSEKSSETDKQSDLVVQKRSHSKLGKMLHKLCGSKTTASNFVILVPVLIICLGIAWLYHEIFSEEPTCTLWMCPYEAMKYGLSLLSNHLQDIMDECYAFIAYTVWFWDYLSG